MKQASLMTESLTGYYAVLIPAEIHFPHTERACVHLTSLTETAHLTVTLHLQQVNLTLLEGKVQPTTYFKCVSFQLQYSGFVPLPAGGSEEVGHVGISVEFEGHRLKNKKKVLLRTVKSGTFLQTNKAVYKPGQTVKFRIVTLNEDFSVENKPYSLVQIQDPNSNRIGQWLEVVPKQGIVDLSFPLSSEPPQGTYVIKVGNDFQHTFTVEEYVLPKFEVQLELPKVVTILDEHLKMTLCGRLLLHGHFHHHSLSSIAGSSSSVDAHRLQKKVPDVTGVTISGSKSCQLSSDIATVTFEETDEYYKKGIPYTGWLTLASADGTPIKDQTVYLFTEWGSQGLNQSYETDDSGRAFFSLDTSDRSSSVNLRGSFKLEQQHWDYGKVVPRYQDAYLWLKPFYSKSKSFLKIHSVRGELPCGHTQDVQVDYIIQRNELHEDAEHMDLHYVASSKAGIIHEGTKKIAVDKEQGVKGTCSIELPVSTDWAPSTKLFVYTIFEDGEVAAATTNLNVVKCFKNEVTLGFSQEEALPGADISLHLHSAAGSLCAVRAVDKSTVLMKPKEELTRDKHGALSYVEMVLRKHASAVMGAYQCKQALANPIRRHLPFKESMPESAPLQANVPPDSQPKVEKQVRKHFPEDWIWDLIAVGESGTATVPVTVPDTITDWVTGTFCLADIGFGMSSPVTLRTFKPFFVDLSLPNSVVRGETFVLQATIFNYLKEPSQIQIQLLKSEEFKVEAHPESEYTGCLGASEEKTVSWSVTPLRLGEMNMTVTTEALDSKAACGNEITVTPSEGRIDTVTKPILVQAGGVLEEKAHSSLLCAQGFQIPPKPLPHKDQGEKEVEDINPPLNPKPQKEEKEDKLFYEEEEEQMGGMFQDSVESEITDPQWYQRQLNYKHDDGSYSAFGKSDQEGNTWLTALVMKSFSQARDDIDVDKVYIDQALKYLKEHPLESGCFNSSGKLLNNALKEWEASQSHGGVEDNLSLSAYVTAAMLELGRNDTDSTVKRAMACLKDSLPTVTNTYTLALMAYTFTLADYKEVRDKVIAELIEQAIKSEGQIHWECKDKPKQEDVPYWYQAPSAEVEMTSYVLLAYMSQHHVSKEDIGTASQIVSWLSKLQNPYGGFSSTQDTVVALNGLAIYAGATFSEKGDVTVTVKSKDEIQQQFHVYNKNRLLLQQAPLTKVPGEYTISAAGKGCVYVQTTLRYNIPPPKSDATFKLAVTPDPESCTEAAKSTFMVTVTARSFGAQLGGRLNGSNLVTVSDIELEGKKDVKKVEIKPDQVTIYLDQLDKTQHRFSFSLEQDNEVKDMKPATVTVYDYYEKGEKSLTEYNAPCSAGNANCALAAEQKRSSLIKIDPKLCELATSEAGAIAQGNLFGEPVVKELGKFVATFSALDKAQNSIKKIFSNKVFAGAGRGRVHSSGRLYHQGPSRGYPKRNNGWRAKATTSEEEVMHQEEFPKKAICRASLHPNGFLSNIFLVEKKDKHFRTVINLKDFNEWLVYRHFKMEGIHLLREILLPNDWMIRLDLKDAYLSVPIFSPHQRFLQFSWKGQIY
ncbi:alpha-2-macroglobulin-like protein 1 [Pleurodeles waltl]|uniref:alpha-2-macroglobulin-like protein 1 n=1 Tax=Pleurodeles waltl TaxID=8319 RepID=UPI003709440A